ncbi:MAG: MTAP family purine nucleoside phosphorylase [Sedimentisphaerales bacterium]|nr:MTAP family purine nucleoside phosphorylase [Sedimentisphaerales bacterium]
MSNGLTGLIGGTGLGDALSERLSDLKAVRIDTPFGKPSGPVLTGKFGGREIAFINRHGAGHKFGPSEVPYAANVYALKKLGATVLISSGAVGSLREEIKPGDLVIVDQFIDKTFKRQNSFFAPLRPRSEASGYGAVHCEFAQPTCGRLRDHISQAAKQADINVHKSGTYVCMEGPQFSTRAESLMHRAWGGDLIGMTALPEAKLAREAQMCYALIALASDYDCWKETETSKDKQTLLEEIIGNLQAATGNCLNLITAVLASDSQLSFDDCQCRKSLELAVWTRNEQIDSAKKKELDVLFD